MWGVYLKENWATMNVDFCSEEWHSTCGCSVHPGLGDPGTAEWSHQTLHLRGDGFLCPMVERAGQHNEGKCQKTS